MHVRAVPAQPLQSKEAVKLPQQACTVRSHSWGLTHSWTDGSPPAGVQLSRAQTVSPERKHAEEPAYLSGARDPELSLLPLQIRNRMKKAGWSFPLESQETSGGRGGGAWWACEDEDADDENQAVNEEKPEEIPEAAQRLSPPGPGPAPAPAPAVPSIPTLPLPSLQCHSFVLGCKLPARLSPVTVW